MAQSIASDLEHVLENLKRFAIPESEWPEQMHYACAICKDKGIEFYRQGELSYARPCPHCSSGKERVAEWVRGGPWKNLGPAAIAAIKNAPCTHDE